MNKTFIRFFTIADYLEEEAWLRSQGKAGWRLVKMTPPCFFLFESCPPEDVIYRLDFKNNMQSPEYMQMVRDYGWEYCGSCVGWLYFRKAAAEVTDKNDGELFSDGASKVEMVEKISRNRMLPLLVIFLCCIVPNLYLLFSRGGTDGAGMMVVYVLLFALYLYLFIHCGGKLRRLKEEYRERP